MQAAKIAPSSLFYLRLLQRQTGYGDKGKGKEEKETITTVAVIFIKK
jgi:hypothetical protein